MTKPIYFDDRVAPHYDKSSASMFAPEVLGPTVEFLTELAAAGDCLEFAVGTGRVALPLSEQGLAVAGIELSPAMVEQLRNKPGAERIDVAVGDMATTRLDRAFRLVYLVFNTITNLTTQAEQVECFRNAAAHLEHGGHFVIEVAVPDLRRLPPGERFRVFTHDAPGYLGLDEYTDFVGQIQYSHHWRNRDGRIGVFSAPYRYVWPSELDLMAQLAGMSLVERWANWRRDPFTDDSESHVSVWRKG